MTQEPKIFPYIERLLQGDEVVWKPLGEVCKVLRGKRLTKKELSDEGIYPVFHGGLIPLGYYNSYNRKGNQTMVINTGSIGEVVWSGVDFWSSDGTFVVETNDVIEDKFLYYYLKTKEQYLKSQKREGGVPTIDRSVVEKLSIPLPPLSVQQEIVRILDKFTQLEAELEAELDCRKRQYEYYRNKLLTFNEIGGGTEIVWKTLGEASKKISSGGTPKTTVSEYYNGEIPWLRTQEVGYGEIWDTSIKITEEAIKNSSAKWIPKDCVIIAMYGATVGRVGINKIPLTTNQACANIEVNEEIANYKYIYYYLLNQYEYIKSLGAGSQTNINAQIVKSLKIPLPPLEEQERIATILDKFDTLVNSISEGLPKEIALRRKQYEYYRERLLSFTNNQ